MDKFSGKIEVEQVKSVSCYEKDERFEEGKPNVLTIVLDDIGFAQLGCYGSDICTPNIDKLASEGLRYNNFHTTAICSASRASLLTGANHHSVGICTVTDLCNGDYPNQKGYTDPQYANMAEVLKEYDYTNFMVGKWHLAPFSDITDAGPYTHWPLGRGFDRFYGFLEGFTDQYNPNLVRDNTRIEVLQNDGKGYHFTEDIIDNAIGYIDKHTTIHPDKPFYMYLAMGTGHSPHQVAQKYIDKYKGKFDEGWDVLRKKWFERQKSLGVIPQDAVLTRRNQLVKAWDSLSDKEKKVYARYMEVFAGFLDHADENIGRLMRYLENAGIKDNTVIMLMSDNGASCEGGKQGLFNQDKTISLEDDRDEVSYAYEHLDDMGNEYSNMNYPIGWANLGNVPFQWYKTFTHAGGVKDPLIIRYPELIKDKGGIRSQYHHITDIAPTIMDILGLKKPACIKGVLQRDYHGISMKYTFENPEEKTHKHIQYFEMLGNRGLWKDGWKLVCNHMFSRDFENDIWELYHTDKDYSESENLAELYPEKVQHMLQWWFEEAGKYGVLPIGLRQYFASPDNKFQIKEQHFTYRNIHKPVDTPCVTIVRGRNHVIDIDFDYNGSDEGVLYAAGHRFGGYVFYIKGNELKYTYNYHREKYTTLSSGKLSKGRVLMTLKFKLQSDSSALAQLYINGKCMDEKMIEGFILMMEARAGIKASVTSSIVDSLPFPFEYPGIIDRMQIRMAPITVNTAEYFSNLNSAD